jgi:hypothetical protein
MAAPITAGLSQRKPTSTATFRGSSGSQNRGKRNALCFQKRFSGALDQSPFHGLLEAPRLTVELFT